MEDFAFISPIPTGLWVSRARPVRACRAKKFIPVERNIRTVTSSSSESQNTDDGATWQQELKLLLNPSLGSGAKQVLLQDLVKRAPEVVQDACSSVSSDPKMRGISDVFRQFSKDVLPDLVMNGPCYLQKALQDLPNNVSRIATNQSGLGNGIPPLNAEDMRREFRNIFNKTPEGLYTPQYVVLGTFDGYEIRKYPSLIVATSTMNVENKVADGIEVESAMDMGRSFNTLAGYLFGKNETNTSMKMTTPVVLEKGNPSETMSFIIGEYSSIEDVPKTLDQNVTLREEVGRTYAVCEFSGFVTQGEANRQREKLLSYISRDSINVTDEGRTSYKCMIYNGPSTLPNLRRNEMLIEVLYMKEKDQ